MRARLIWYVLFSCTALILDFFLPPFLSNPLFWQGRIDVRSLRPPVKEDEVDRDARRRSAKKQKSAKDSVKKGEKKKNLDRQALDACRAKSRQRGSLRKNPPATMIVEMVMRTATTPRGWRLASTGSSRVRLEATSTPHGWKHQRRDQVDLTALVTTPPRVRDWSGRPMPSHCAQDG